MIFFVKRKNTQASANVPPTLFFGGEGRYNSSKYIQLICNGYIYFYFTAKKIQLKINDFETNLVEPNEQFVLNRKGKTCPFFSGIWKMDS